MRAGVADCPPARQRHSARCIDCHAETSWTRCYDAHKLLTAHQDVERMKQQYAEWRPPEVSGYLPVWEVLAVRRCVSLGEAQVHQVQMVCIWRVWVAHQQVLRLYVAVDIPASHQGGL